MYLNTKGLVVRVTPYNDTDAILSILTPNYGKLTVISQTENREFGSVKWLCKCECGSYCEVAGDALRQGQTQSCGCGMSA